VVALVAVAVISALRSGDDEDGGSTATVPPGGAPPEGVGQPGAAAPGFDLPGLRGGRVRLADYAGRPVVLNFWASWCVPCRKEFPELRRVARRYRSDGLAVVGVTYRDLDDDARAFARRMGATWPLAAGGRGDPVARDYGVRFLPQTFFVDRDGTIVARSFGALSNDRLQAQVEKLLHSSQENARAASSGAPTAQISSTTSSPPGRPAPGSSTPRTHSASAAAGRSFATASRASGRRLSG
jgi:cytochrome c biogenesis protein CcmG/thiol:disulfide interchange protein DsbE